eukprot:Gb_13929 [translate_table: standard]
MYTWNGWSSCNNVRKIKIDSADMRISRNNIPQCLANTSTYIYQCFHVSESIVRAQNALHYSSSQGLHGCVEGLVEITIALRVGPQIFPMTFLESIRAFEHAGVEMIPSGC